MAAILTNDAQLQKQIYSREKVTVYFFSPLCETCLILTPQFKQVALQPEYEGILFLLINAAENPAAKQSVDFREMPIIAAYSNGKVIAANPVYDIDGIIATVEKLRQGHQEHNHDDECCSF